MLLSILVSYSLPVLYLKRVVARKVDQGDSSSLGNPSASTSDHLAVEDPKHLSGLADIKVRSSIPKNYMLLLRLARHLVLIKESSHSIRLGLILHQNNMELNPNSFVKPSGLRSGFEQSSPSRRRTRQYWVVITLGEHTRVAHQYSFIVFLNFSGFILWLAFRSLILYRSVIDASLSGSDL